MPKFVSLSLRDAIYSHASSDTAIVLATITHDDLETPLRLSSDRTQRITDDPLVYGTISNGDTYYFALMDAMLPHDEEERPPATALVFENVTGRTVPQIRSILSPITVRLDLVMKSAPNQREETFTEFKSTRFTWNSSTLTIYISREPLVDEQYPIHRMTKEWFPGLFK